MEREVVETVLEMAESDLWVEQIWLKSGIAHTGWV